MTKSVVFELNTFPSQEDMVLMGCCFDDNGDPPDENHSPDDGYAHDFPEGDAWEGDDAIPLLILDPKQDRRRTFGAEDYTQLLYHGSAEPEFGIRQLSRKHEPVRRLVLTPCNNNQEKPKLGDRDTHGKRFDLVGREGEMKRCGFDLKKRPKDEQKCDQRKTIRRR